MSEMVWLAMETWDMGIGGGMQIVLSQNKILKKNWVIWKLLVYIDEPVKT